jgi:5'-3' exonuclease
VNRKVNQNNKYELQNSYLSLTLFHMGVPGLFSYLSKRYNKPFMHRKNTSDSIPESLSIDNLLIDGNALLHPVARGYYFAKQRKTGNVKPKPKTDEECYKLISEAVITIIRRANPKKKVVFGIDGSVPFAKSAEQRKRRFGAVSQSSGTTSFNTSQISVATPWMMRLHKYLLNAVRNWAIEFPNVEMVYESFLVPGECEHRLVDTVREGTTDETYMVHGSDADIISLLLLCKEHTTYILRDRVDERVNECCVIDIQELKTALLTDYLPEVKYKGGDRVMHSVGNDDRLNSLIFVWYLVGMDFLPRCPSLEIFNGGMDLIANTIYQTLKTHGSIVNTVFKRGEVDYEINKKALITWLRIVSTHDKELIHRKAKAKCLVPDSILEKFTTIDYECNVQVDVLEYKNAYNAAKFPSDGELLKASKNYLDGLQWTFMYYTKGVPSWTWCYSYHYSPWADDLATALSDRDYRFPKFTRDKSEPFPEYLQLLFILPPQSFHLLPKELRGIKDELPEMFPESVEKDEEGVEREWEIKSLTPFVDWKLVKELYMKKFPYTIDPKNARVSVKCE